MKTNRFLSLAIIFAVLMSASSAYTQNIAATLAACSAGELFSCLVVAKKTYDFLKKKEDEAAVKYMGTTFNEWGKKQMDYMKANGQIGDCKDIKFLPSGASYNQPTNSFKNGDFSYECGKRPGKGGDSTAYIKAKTVRKIGDCPAENSFIAKINYVDGYIAFAAEPLNTACVFFEEPSLTNKQKEDRAKEVKQWRASAEASQKPQTAEKPSTSRFNSSCTDPAKGGGKLLYCGYTSPLGCYKVQNMYPDIETGLTCAEKPSAKGCEPCPDKISACERDGTLYISVNPEKLNAKPWGAGVSCIKEGGIKIGGR